MLPLFLAKENGSHPPNKIRHYHLILSSSDIYKDIRLLAKDQLQNQWR